MATVPEDILRASSILLPGVGAFDFVMQSFNKSGLRAVVEKKVLDEKVPVLGICAGMQILADASEEGEEKGLSWVSGIVKRFDTTQIPYKTKIPHMGWNEIQPNGSSGLFQGIPSGSRYYFVHSYYFEVENDENIIATSHYGIEFTASVGKGNIFGTQFHPEKSHLNGMRLLKNFAELK